jgi:hypothetical protein
MERINGSRTGRHTAVVQHLATAIAELKAMDEETDRAMSRDSALSEESPRIACAFCGKPMMPAATICGFCWRRPIDSKGAGVSTR